MKKFSVFILAAIFVLTMAACADNGNSGQSPAPQNSALLLEDFESYNDLVRFRFMNSFRGSLTGSLKLNTNTDYISNGSASVQFQVYPEKLGKFQSSLFYVPTVTAADVDYSDFTKIREFSIDVYNDSDTEQTVELFVSKATTALILNSAKQGQKIPAREWKEVVFYVDPTAIDFVLDVTSISHIGVSVMGIDPLVYIDNLRIKTTEAAATILDIELDEMEVCSFDKPYQKFVTMPVTGGSVTPVLELNYDLNYSTGGRSLKVTLSPSADNSYPRFELSQKLMTAVNLDRYRSENYELCFDIKKEFSQQFSIFPRFRRSSNNAYLNSSWSVPAGTDWYTVRYKLADIPTGTDELQFNFRNTVDYERVFYIDNIRIEKVK